MTTPKSFRAATPRPDVISIYKSGFAAYFAVIANTASRASGLLLTRRLKLISALIIIFAAELCAGCLAVGVINVCLIRRRSRTAGDKQACK
ncbi:MAG: hypothetical protein WA728_29945 [Xanthobacteraceae bacterium]